MRWICFPFSKIPSFFRCEVRKIISGALCISFNNYCKINLFLSNSFFEETFPGMSYKFHLPISSFKVELCLRRLGNRKFFIIGYLFWSVLIFFFTFRFEIYFSRFLTDFIFFESRLKMHIKLSLVLSLLSTFHISVI